MKKMPVTIDVASVLPIAKALIQPGYANAQALLTHRPEDIASGMSLGERMYGEGVQDPFAFHKSDKRVKVEVPGYKNEGERIHHDWEFTEFAPELVGSPLHTVWQTMQAGLPGKLCRFRIVSIKPYRTYPFHCDEVVRYHFALQTTPDCLFFIAEGNTDFSADKVQVYHVPADGHAYELNGRDNMHSAMNGSTNVDRIHFIVSTVDV